MKVKICGINSEDALEAAVAGGADLVGVVFFPPSPRQVSVARAAELLQFLPRTVQRVGLFVDPDDGLLDQVMNNLRLDWFQFHGRETPERVEAVRQEYGMRVIKAVPVAEAADLDAAQAYAEVADWLLFDAKAPPGADRPGGNAAVFDWTMLKGRRWPVPWMLAGGLTPANVAEAIAASGAKAVDVSSGVESAPGVKDAALIAEFVKQAKGR